MKTETERHYFVDEAGDLTLFNKKGRVIIGSEGCSNYFILGIAQIEIPHEVRKTLEALRAEVLSDSYLQPIPSIQKTKIAFHAKDDCSEVKMQVFKLLKSLPVKIYAIVRRKSFLVESVRKNNQLDPTWRYDENKVYDACVKRLFKDRLHSSPMNHIVFARRGKSLRNEALTQALLKAKQNFEKTKGKIVTSGHEVISQYPSNEPGLQVIDYFLWALQRLYEKHEERFFFFVQDKFERIIDLDDKREKDYGIYYDRRNPLTALKIKNSLEG